MSHLQLALAVAALWTAGNLGLVLVLAGPMRAMNALGLVISSVMAASRNLVRTSQVLNDRDAVNRNAFSRIQRTSRWSIIIVKFVDYYEVLEISPNANSETIERMFRYLALRYHPDSKETGDRSHFDLILEAHEALRDSAKRAQYDIEYRRIQVSDRNWPGSQRQRRRRAGHRRAE